MKTLYLDCFSGISGDMTIAALLDLGLSQKNLESELRKLGVSKEYHLHIARKKQQQITGTKFDVHSHHEQEHHHHPYVHGNGHGNGHSNGHDHHGHDHTDEHYVSDHHNGHSKSKNGHGRTFVDIRKMIEKSKLSSFVKETAVSIFHRIAVVEGKIHGVSPEKVHFHEVGAIDSIVDIVGVSILLEELDAKQILASIPCEGTGFVECAHGRFPVPTAATLELLRGIRFRQIDILGELITPTGAAILAEVVENFGSMPSMVVQKIGYGLGTRTYPNHPNLLRAILGEADPIEKSDSEMAVDILETNVDDISPEILAAAMEKLLKAGARDAYLTPIQMKKGRAGNLITVLSEPEMTKSLSEILLQETGSFGLRLRRSERICLERVVRKVKTTYGIVEIKIGSKEGRVISAKPEFETCRKLAEKRKVPVRKVWIAALAECAKILNK
jgi:uncharacterized protein (TIGR00299 family) protein